MTGVHVGLGVLALALNAAAGALGAWCWWRAAPARWFWILLRAGQASIVLEALLGGVLQLGHPKAPAIHLLYGLLPIGVSFVAEQLRIASAQMIMDSRGFSSTAEVATLPAEEQRQLVVVIVRREVGVMTLAALVIVVLLVRAAGTS